MGSPFLGSSRQKQKFLLGGGGDRSLGLMRLPVIERASRHEAKPDSSFGILHNSFEILSFKSHKHH